MAICSFLACKEDIHLPKENDKRPPGAVKSAVVTPLPGGALIRYVRPDDEDLLYVKAVYKTHKGELREYKSSSYNDEITITGFGDTSVYKVQLYAVDEGENVSQPLDISVKPLKPSHLIVQDSIRVIPDFGGITLQYVNDNEENIAIVVLGTDALGNFSPVSTFYTKTKKGEYAVRGFAAEKMKFGVFVRDRWQNLSDTSIFELTPLFEQRLDKSKMKALVLPNDAQLGYSGNVQYLFDDIIGNMGWYHTGDQARMPQWFTFDMGVRAKLSRLVWHMREGHYYNLHNPRIVEIWGSNNPSANGSWDNWELMAEYEQRKPSGLPAGQLSQADIDAAIQGETVRFSLTIKSYRYIRFKTLRNWSNGTYVNFNELTLFGSIE